DRDRDRDRGGRRGPSFNRDRDRDERSSVGAAQAIGSSMVPPSFPQQQQQQPAPESTPHQSNQSQHQVPLQRHPPLHPTERAYDAAVIASSTEVRPYAESVERRLNRLSLSTNLIVLKHESLMPLAMEDLARTGVLYAVILNRQNELHQSCTVRIFYGQQPFEHRNMPIDDAQSMLGRHFETVLRDLRELPPPASVAAPTGNERLPAGFVRPTPRLMHLLHLLADHRMLSGRELDELAEFISARRERLAAGAGSPNIGQIQKALDSLFGGSGGGGSGAGAGGAGGGGGPSLPPLPTLPAQQQPQPQPQSRQPSGADPRLARYGGFPRGGGSGGHENW
uniref:Nuclear receptor coactivator 5 n=1 Tax=Macrostomum lignano TaxID=282301 RepID=A0A1I8GW33_9PLAT